MSWIFLILSQTSHSVRYLAYIYCNASCTGLSQKLINTIAICMPEIFFHRETRMHNVWPGILFKLNQQNKGLPV